MHEILQHFFGWVCGQEPAHTWAPCGLLLPFCQRCSGLYAGAFVAAVLHVWLRPAPTNRWLWLNGSFLLLMVPFGFHWLPQGPLLRTVTGVLFGFGLVAFLALGRNRSIADEVRPHPGPVPQERESPVAAPGTITERLTLSPAANGSPSPWGEGRGEGDRCPSSESVRHGAGWGRKSVGASNPIDGCADRSFSYLAASIATIGLVLWLGTTANWLAANALILLATLGALVLFGLALAHVALAVRWWIRRRFKHLARATA